MNRYTFLSFIALLALVIVIPYYALQEQTRLSAAQDELQAQYIENGAVLYLEFCGECHGPTGEGIGLNPALNRLGMSEADPEVLFKIIARATHGSSMASWHLEEGGVFNDYQIRELVTLIRFADWSQVQRLAAERGVVFTDLSTRNLEDISVDMLSEEDPHQCIACHEDPKVHKEKFGLDCVRCHSLVAWTPASLTRHTFKLDHGDAGDVACETCHIETYTKNTCYECHDHKPGQMTELHEAEGILEFDFCISCHPTGTEGEGRDIWQEMLERENNAELLTARSNSQ
jgi:mono/diheme cytochrome c family protein